ncbi:MAG: 50S ribosomal protein L20 [Puniceicoccaceae bacterium]
MPKATNHQASRKRRKRVLRGTKGYFGNASRLYRYAKQATDRAGQYAYRDRRNRKREFRKLWIVRINAACRQHGVAYSRFIAGLNKAGIELDRKALSELAIHDEAAFKALVEQSQSALAEA